VTSVPYPLRSKIAKVALEGAFCEDRQQFIANSSQLASVVELYIQAEAKKPASMKRWALERRGQS
jgi:hypothetical protein